MLLTNLIIQSKLYLHSQKTGVGITTPGITGQKAAGVDYDKAVFLCPSKIISTALVRLKSVLVGCVGPLSSGPVPVTGCGNPLQPASNYLPLVRGGYILITGETAMRNHTQKPTNAVSGNQSKFNPIFDLFKLTDGVKRLVCTGINLDQARALIKENSAYRLHFTGSFNGGAA